MTDNRATFDASELAGLARQHGARRGSRDGIGFWRFPPPWVCPWCPQLGPAKRPEPLARHGPIEE